MKKTVEQFIKEAKQVHGDRYDYTNTIYTRSAEPVSITCRKHGEFSQKAARHLRGSGCPKCAIDGRTGNIHKFLLSAIEVHGNTYDYSKVKYTTAKTKVTIICREHGDFQQFPDVHLSGSGCPKCAGKNRELSEFVRDSKSIHGEKYDYSKVRYTKSTENVTITCKVHGDFEQPPFRHLHGYGCLKCAISERAVGLSGSVEDFVSRSVAKHGDRYDYSKVVYINNHTKVVLVCREHGEFLQTPASHLSGNGCCGCASTGYNSDKRGFFYIYVSEMFVGFGISNNMENRAKTHKRNFKKHNITADLVHVCESDGATIRDLERAVKHKFKSNIVNTGIEGFKWEAVKPEVFNDLLNFVEEYAKENRPSGRSNEASAT